MDPILIYTPKWRNNAAGIKVLYLLCDKLNNSGIESYIVQVDIGKNRPPKNLNIMYLKRARTAKKILKEKRPIVIYSETIKGNPLDAKRVIRYILNYPGLLNGIKFQPSFDLLLPYSHNIYEYLKKNEYKNILNPLFLSSIDINEVQYSKHKQDFVVLYASKFRRIYGKPKIPEINKKVIEIYGHNCRAQSRAEVLDLISNAFALISFENSAIVTESVLSGTPVFLHKNPLTENPIASFELGDDGVRDLSELHTSKFQESEFLNARQMFNEANMNSNKQIIEFVEFLKNHQFPKSRPDKIRLKPHIIRVLIHKYGFVCILMTRILKRGRKTPIMNFKLSQRRKVAND